MQGILDTLGAIDAREFTPADGVTLVMLNPPPKAGTLPKALISKEKGSLNVKLISGLIVPIPVAAGVPVPLTCEEYRISAGISKVVGII